MKFRHLIQVVVILQVERHCEHDPGHCDGFGELVLLLRIGGAYRMGLTSAPVTAIAPTNRITSLSHANLWNDFRPEKSFQPRDRSGSNSSEIPNLLGNRLEKLHLPKCACPCPAEIGGR